MHGSRRLFLGSALALAAMAAVADPAFALIDRSAGMTPFGGKIKILLATPTTHTSFEVEPTFRAVQGAIDALRHEADVLGVTIDLRSGATLIADEVDPYPPSPSERLAFVDGTYFLGADALTALYRDRVYAPKHAAMQPDNGAGQVSGDRAQSVGKGGGEKPGGVNSGSTPATPGGKAIDATKQSWIGRAYRRFISPAYS